MLNTCDWRLDGKRPDGTVAEGICRCPEHAKYRCLVQLTECATCPLRSTGLGSPAAQPVPASVTPPPPPSVPRPDLAAIELTLPAASPNPDATFQRPVFHTDGSIEYPRKEGDWEIPQNISGYTRDTSNNFLFHPLWPPCSLRHMTAFLKTNCGCISIVSRCASPQSPSFGQRVAHTDCESCPVRKA